MKFVTLLAIAVAVAVAASASAQSEVPTSAPPSVNATAEVETPFPVVLEPVKGEEPLVDEELPLGEEDANTQELMEINRFYYYPGRPARPYYPARPHRPARPAQPSRPRRECPPGKVRCGVIDDNDRPMCCDRASWD